MKTTWDYTNLASTYRLRPQYATPAIDAIFSISGAKPGDKICDVGAGVGHLTVHHIRAGHTTVAVEPNDEMRRIGAETTQALGEVVWKEGTGESTAEPSRAFNLVTFGSSFNVCDRQLALIETHRILKEGGWFACLWNHRDLSDPIQEAVEKIIANRIPGYSYGSRREDQTEIIRKSGLFEEPVKISSIVFHEISVKDSVEAWRSHATLERQAGDKFSELIKEIEEVLLDLNSNDREKTFMVPYETVAWIAKSAPVKSS